MTKIFYFSGTGNSEFVARSLAERLGGDAVNLVGFEGTVDADCVGFVTACYCSDLPVLARELIDKLQIARADYIFYVTTSQISDGFCALTVKKLLQKKGLSLSLAQHVGMLSTFVVTVFPFVAKSEKHYRSREAATIEEIACRVESRASKPVHCPAYPIFKCTSTISGFGLKNIVGAKRKTVTDACTGCAKCVAGCPCGNIKIVDGRAVFGDNCTLCYGCAHLCPSGAVKYGFNNIKGKKQYKRFR